jgi:hypothetical protein
VSLPGPRPRLTAHGRAKISRGDKMRIALAPLHVLIGGVLLHDFAKGPRAPMVLVLGVAFVAFGVYRLALVWRGLKRGR